jgi:hypothetical protein
MKQALHKKKIGWIRSDTDSRRTLGKFNLALLLSLITMIFVLPVLPWKEPFLTRVVLILILVSGLFAAEFSRRLFKILSGLGAFVIGFTVITIFFIQSINLSFILFFLNTLFFVVVTVALISQVAQAKKVEGSTVICAINSYLLIGLSSALLIAIIDLAAPNSFGIQVHEGEALSTFIYFAFVTLTTLGYGDISPLTPLARSFSTFTALCGQLYLVIIMALIVGKYLNAKASDQ